MNMLSQWADEAWYWLNRALCAVGFHTWRYSRRAPGLVGNVRGCYWCGRKETLVVHVTRPGGPPDWYEWVEIELYEED